MERLLPAAITIALMALMLGLALWGWRSRRRRQRTVAAPASIPAELGAPRHLVEAIAHATTLAAQPLERITVHGLGFRSRIQLGVHEEGVVLAIPGREPIFIPAAELVAAGRGTWTIDRAVEPGGLTVLTWRLGETAVDTWLRVPGGEDAALLDALRALLPPTDERPTDDA
jgi:hypothetical protein